MRIIKINDRLYRIHNNGIYKDVWIEHGQIKHPVNPHNFLTPTEQQAIEMEIF